MITIKNYKCVLNLYPSMAKLEKTEDLISKAYIIAFQAHIGQKDKAGKSYIGHPLRVALMGNNEDEIVLGLLHDVVEDNPKFTFEYLESKGIPQHILDALKCITKSKDESRKQYIKRVATNRLATIVKINDLKHNSDLSRLPGKPTEKDFKRTEMYEREIKYLKGCLENGKCNF